MKTLAPKSYIHYVTNEWTFWATLARTQKIIAAYEIAIMLAGGECTLCTRYSRVQQLGSTHLSGPTMFAHGQQILYKSYDIN